MVVGLRERRLNRPFVSLEDKFGIYLASMQALKSFITGSFPELCFTKVILEYPQWSSEE